MIINVTLALNNNCLYVGPVGYREKGYPKQDPKNDCLDFVKIETS